MSEEVAAHPAQVQSKSSREHIVILGAGFAGWYAARHLAAILPLQHRITLVDRADHMLYTPLLTEVAGGTVPASSIAVPTAKLPRRVRFLQAEIASVDVTARSVRLASGEALHWTQLVLAVGATTAYHDVPGAKEHSYSMKTLADANAIRERLDHLVQAAASRDSPGSELSLVVAGGGYTGVESMAALNTRMRERASLLGVPQSEIQATLVEPRQSLMNEVPESLADYSKVQLEADGIRVIVGVGVKAVKADELVLTNDQRLPVSLFVWDTGIEPSSLVAGIDVPRGKHHGVVADAMFRVPGRSGVWAVGDCAEIPDTQGGTYSPTAQNASREGIQVARNIVAVLKGRTLRPFRFVMLGQLTLISRKNAVAEILGVQLRGLLTWVLWWVIYILKLPDNPRRITVLKSLLLPAEQQ